MIYLIAAVWFILGYIYFIHDMRKVQDIGIETMIAGLFFGWAGIVVIIGEIICRLINMLPTYVVFKKYE